MAIKYLMIYHTSVHMIYGHAVRSTTQNDSIPKRATILINRVELMNLCMKWGHFFVEPEATKFNRTIIMFCLNIAVECKHQLT